jgi:hypothetical protein
MEALSVGSSAFRAVTTAVPERRAVITATELEPRVPRASTTATAVSPLAQIDRLTEHTGSDSTRAVSPAARMTLFGEILGAPAHLKGMTLILAEALSAPRTAHTDAVPGVTPVTRPRWSTVAIDGALLRHLTVDRESEAASRAVSPAINCKVDGATDKGSRGAEASSHALATKTVTQRHEKHRISPRTLAGTTPSRPA